jgi:hypothetical protein
MKKILTSLAAGALVPFGWWVEGGEFVRGPDLASMMACSVCAAVFVFLLLRDQ